MDQYKISKYENKLANARNDHRAKIYASKLNRYMRAGALTLHLEEPHKLAVDELPTDNIRAYGYGQLKRNHDLVPVIFDRRHCYPSDVTVQIMYCGVCHSDWHYIVGEWAAGLPLVPGHEMSGRIINVGSAVTKFKIGDPVAVGTIVNSCRRCRMCDEHHEQYCLNGASATYDSRDRKPTDTLEPTGEKTYGGYSDVITVNENYVYNLYTLPLDTSAPLLCAGITTYSPLKQFGVVPGMTVGVAGIGGLGHIAVQIANAMGAKVVALTRTPWKLSDILKLGAVESILVTDKKAMDKLNGTLDLIIDTIPKTHDLNPYIDLLRYNGTLWVLGPFTNLQFDMGLLASKNASIKSSITGGVADTHEMLKFCSDHGVKPVIELIDINQINSTYDKLLKSQVRYRFVIDMNKN